MQWPPAHTLLPIYAAHMPLPLSAVASWPQLLPTCYSHLCSGLLPTCYCPAAHLACRLPQWLALRYIRYTRHLTVQERGHELALVRHGTTQVARELEDAQRAWAGQVRGGGGAGSRR